MQQYVYELYQKYSNDPLERRISLARTAYRKMEEHLGRKYNSWDAFNGVICLTLMCLSGDGYLTQNEYEIFKKVSNATPTYNELLDTACNLDYQLIVDKYSACGPEALGLAVVLCAIMFACKESYGRDEQALINALSRYL